MILIRLTSLSLLSLLIVNCKPKKVFKADSKLFNHWVNNDTLHPGGFIISVDSFFYPDYKRSFFYVIDKDSLEVIFPDKTSKSGYSIQNDTLIFTSKEGSETFWRKQ
nr:hypothetical protein [uncultured Lacibacter sp.]